VRVEVNGTSLWFDTDGSALEPAGRSMRERPTVVLLHGGPGSFDHTYLEPDFERLRELAALVYVDLRGHGRSAPIDPQRWTIEACADDVRAFCDVLGIAKPIVYGHSLGGLVAVAYGVRHPGHAGALVLQSAAARFHVPRIVDTFRRMGGDAMARTVERVYAHQLPVTDEEWAPCWKLFGPHVPGEAERARTIVRPELNAPGLRRMSEFDVRDRLGAIECPTLVCVGQLDPVTPVECSREILDGLRPGIGRLEVVADAGHFPWKDDPEAYWPIVEHFVLEP
jgi:proline iminopeptidase